MKMIDLIKEALGELAELPYNSTKKLASQTLKLEDYSVAEIIEKTKDLGIPLEAITVETDECRTLGTTTDIYLEWAIKVDKTEEDIARDVKARFIRGAYSRISPLLTANGYTRAPLNSPALKKFEHTNVYDLYMAKDFDTLEAYYSLRFKKEEI